MMLLSYIVMYSMYSYINRKGCLNYNIIVYGVISNISSNVSYSVY